MSAIASAISKLVSDDRQAIVTHIEALAALSPGKRAAIMALARPE